jgi:bifunctional DNA-binding transcriptional regulator/antitoxin component of YhaV-PrlF toxin-antitoxin module
MNHTHTALKMKSVSRVKLGGRGRVTIPTAIVKRLRLKHGDELNIGVFESDQAIVLAPRRSIPKEQEWYYTPRWQKMMREAFDDVKHGRLLGPFKSAEDLIQELRS